MIKFIVEFTGGEYDEHYYYVQVIESKCKDDLEYKLLEILKTEPEDRLFKHNLSFDRYVIYTLEEWIKRQTITLKQIK